MALTFTTVTDGFAPQLRMAEIIDATNERRAAALASGATGLPDAIPATGGSVQTFQGVSAKPTHLLIQEMLEAIAPYYVDHAASAPYITPYTVATWRSRSGLNSSGYRRAVAWSDPTLWPSYSYGTISTGDIAGPWIWQDIVLGLQALQWTRTSNVTPWGQEQKTAYVEYYPLANYNWTHLIADYETAFSAAEWENVPSAGILCSMTLVMSSGIPNLGFMEMTMYRSYPHIDFGSHKPPVSASVEWWLKPNSVNLTHYYAYDSHHVGQWFKHDTSSVAANALVVYSDQTISGSGPSLGDQFTPPTAYAPLVKGGYRISSPAYALLKWNFSRA